MNFYRCKYSKREIHAKKNILYQVKVKVWVWKIKVPDSSSGVFQFLSGGLWLEWLWLDILYPDKRKSEINVLMTRVISKWSNDLNEMETLKKNGGLECINVSINIFSLQDFMQLC